MMETRHKWSQNNPNKSTGQPNWGLGQHLCLLLYYFCTKLGRAFIINQITNITQPLMRDYRQPNKREMCTRNAHTRESWIREANHKQARIGFLSADYQLQGDPRRLILKLVISREAREVCTMSAIQPRDFRVESCEIVDIYKKITIPNGIESHEHKLTIFFKSNGGDYWYWFL